MNRKALMIVGLGIAALAAAGQQGILLRRELKENSTDVYKMEADMKGTVTVPSMGDQDLGLLSTMKVTLKTGKVDTAKGEAEVETVVSDIQNKADGMMQMAMDQNAANMPKEISSKGTMDARGHMVMTAAKTSGMMEMMVGAGSPGSSLMFVEFPDKAVNVGDSWNFSMPKSPIFGKDAPSITAKLVGEKDYQGAKAWVISIAGKINIDADMTEMLKNAPNNPMAGQKMLMKGTIDMTGESLVDKVTGKTLVYTANAKSKSTMTMPDMGMSIDSVSAVKTTLTLQKP